MNIITHQFYINRNLSKREASQVQSEIAELPGVLQCALESEWRNVEITYDTELCTKEEIQSVLQAFAPLGRIAWAVHYRALFFLLAFFGLFFYLISYLSFPWSFQWILYILAGFIGLITPLYRLKGEENILRTMATHAVFYDTSYIRHPAFGAGRAIGYALTGFFWGIVGYSLRQLLPDLFGGIQLFLALYIFAMGLYLLGVRPIAGLQRKLPAYKGSLHPKGKFITGLMSIFIPIVPFQAAQLFVLGYASPVFGALMLLILTLASLPLMVQDETLYRQDKVRLIRGITLKLALLIMILSLLLFGRGLVTYGVNLSGLPGYVHVKGLLTPQENRIRHGVALLQEERQFINIHVTEDGFRPTLIYAQKGIPLTLRFYNVAAPEGEEIYFTPPGVRELLLDSITDIHLDALSEDITFYNFFSTKVGRIHVSENPKRSALYRGRDSRIFLDDNYDRSHITARHRDITGMVTKAELHPLGNRQSLGILGKNQSIEPFVFVVEVGVPVWMHLDLENFSFEDDVLTIYRVEDGSFLTELPLNGIVPSPILFPDSGLYALVDHDHILAVFSVDSDIEDLDLRDIYERYFGDF